MSNPASTHNLTAEWQAIDAAHHLQPFTDYQSLHAKGSRVITRADGVYVWDSDGNQLLDGMAGLWYRYTQATTSANKFHRSNR